MDVYHILVIVLSVLMILVLAIALVFLFVLIKVIRQVKRITDKADAVIDKVESAGEMFRKTTTRLSIARYLRNFARSVNKRKNR